jgi:hypothetical protein
MRHILALTVRTRGKINCPRCSAIIRFCKAIPAAFVKV